jgi:predicted DNA-binding transcriptional regulator YafY
VSTDEAVVGVESRVRTAEPSFGALYEATRDRAPVRFRYRTGGTGEPTERTVEPWRITNWHGRWYLVGHDRDRDDARVFRLSRIEGRPQTVGRAGSVTPPADVDARAMVQRVLAGSGPTDSARTARVRLDAGSGLTLRRRAGADLSPGALDDDSSVVEVTFTDLDDLAEEVAALGASALVEGPPDLREAVVDRLRRVAAAHRAEEAS